MSHFPLTAARLAFFGMFDESEAAVIRAPSPIRARIDQVASGHGAEHSPDNLHTVHGAIPLERGCELRVTTTAGRIWIRRWYKKEGEDGWWSTKGKSVQIKKGEARAFEQAVRLAVLALTSGAKP